MQQKIERWLERLPEATTSIVLRAGESRQTETIIERWQPDAIADLLDDCLDLMADEYQGRLIAYGAKGRQLRSITIRNTDAEVTNHASDTQMLVEGLLRMADEQRRFLATITDTFETMHETVRDCLHTERDTAEELGETQIALALAQIEQETHKESTADKALSIFAQVLQQTGTAAAEKARDMVLNNPSIIDELLDDPTIVQMVVNKMSGTDSE